jgi:diadenosine tetraphosphatase ApaH/serine/threonine PP2A family protein phosphatase
LRYGLIADVHANYRALHVALTRLRAARVDRLLFMGDLVGYGAEPAECVDLFRSLDTDAASSGQRRRPDRGASSGLDRGDDRVLHAISGNHDRQLLGDPDPNMRRTAVRALEWTRSILTEEQITYLHKLPQGQTVGPRPGDDMFIMVHGSLVSRDAYILSNKEVEENRKLMLEEFKGMRVCFFAHTHIPLLVGTDSVVKDLKETKAFQLDPDSVYLINPGSVGQPRDRCPLAAFGVFDTSNWTVTFFREPYDVAGAKRAIIAAGLPEKFARRLEVGV